MTGTVLHLRSHEVWRALEMIDPVATVAEYLIDRTVDRAGHGRRPVGRLTPWSGPEAGEAELVVLAHPDATTPCVVPAQSLRSSHAAALAAVAAREMLVFGAVTMAVLGSLSDAYQLSTVARHVPDISHVALCGVGMDSTTIEPKLVDQLQLAGIGLSVVPTVAEAVFGANLVIVTYHTTSPQHVTELRIGQLARGAVLVNATGRDLPAELLDQVDVVYVDDLDLLDSHADRAVVAAHRAEARISGDLAQLLTGRRSGRRSASDIVLVELLGVHELNADLAYRIYEVATHAGLGVWTTN